MLKKLFLDVYESGKVLELFQSFSLSSIRVLTSPTMLRGEVIFCAFFLFCHMNVQHIKIIVLKFEVDWSKTNGNMDL